MAERIEVYYRFYNKEDCYYSPPMTKKQLLFSIEMGLNTLGENNVIDTNITPIYLTATQLRTKEFERWN